MNSDESKTFAPKYIMVWLSLLTVALVVFIGNELIVLFAIVPTSWNAQTILKGVGVFVALATLYFLFRQVRQARNTNAISVWTAIWDKLQTDEVGVGREILRNATWKDSTVPEMKDWKNTFKAMENTNDYKAAPWFVELTDENNPGKRCAMMTWYARKAYRGFDLAGHVLLAAGNPRLTLHFVCAYIDGIKACFLKGEVFFEERARKERRELYVPLTILYEIAKQLYPEERSPYFKLSLFDECLFRWRHLKPATKRAKRKIDGLAS